MPEKNATGTANNAAKDDTPFPDIQESAVTTAYPEPVSMTESGPAAAFQSPRPPVQAVTSSPQTEFIDLLRRTWAGTGTTESVTSPTVIADTYQRLQELRNFLTDENHGANVA
ncbi:hypothetical protein IFM46972_01499 [Aspergillus udagawae]|uniref:Uncharacterized protein n=1 Tax=Aspergillus udagawae TaxID=91492 RepID=A0A8H3N7W9_9EURO|nr:hypothetical protein IFM46972_01499 [Aspergillus udagawae]